LRYKPGGFGYTVPDMQGKATIAGHPIHPPLVAVPIGCFVAAGVSDVVSIWTNHAFLATMSTWLIGFGIAGALLAGIFGFIDYLTAPMTMRAKRTASWHAILNLIATFLFCITLAVRVYAPSSIAGYMLTIAGLIVLAMAGWLGGELVSRHLVGCSESDAGAIKTPASQAAQNRARSRIGTV
jgi:uncharacterized membrane protein